MINTSNRVPAFRRRRAMTGWGFGGLARLWHAMLVIVVAGWSTAGLAQTATLEGAGASGTAAFPARGADDAPPDPASRTYAVRFMRIAYSSCGRPELPGSQGIGLHISLLLGI